MINLIWAMTEDYIIGQNNSLPWKIKAEMQYFAQTTKGHTILMGRRTFESIGRPLNKRHNIILTRNQEWTKKTKNEYPELEITDNLPAVIRRFANLPQQLFIIGGKEVFFQTYLYADQLYISVIKGNYQGNVKLDFFPEIIKGFYLAKEQNLSQFLTRLYKKRAVNLLTVK